MTCSTGSATYVIPQSCQRGGKHIIQYFNNKSHLDSQIYTKCVLGQGSNFVIYINDLDLFSQGQLAL